MKMIQVRYRVWKRCPAVMAAGRACNKGRGCKPLPPLLLAWEGLLEHAAEAGKVESVLHNQRHASCHEDEEAARLHCLLHPLIELLPPQRLQGNEHKVAACSSSGQRG